MKQIIFTTLVAMSLLSTPAPASANDLPSQQDVKCPVTLEVTGTVVIKQSKTSKTPKTKVAKTKIVVITAKTAAKKKKSELRNSAVVNDSIWWEGDTRKLRLENNDWVEIKLVRVEHGKAIFELHGKHRLGLGPPTQFQVKINKIKKSSTWGLERPTKKKASKKTNKK